MKTLLILRHAKAVPKDPSLSDHDRPLDKVGEDDALRMGELMKDKHILYWKEGLASVYDDTH
jgi:phosphohistidine phosphatase